MKIMTAILISLLVLAGTAGAKTEYRCEEQCVFEGKINLNCFFLCTQDELESEEIRLENCPYRIKSVPESEVDEWLQKGWDPFGVSLKWIINGMAFESDVYIYLRKRECREGE